MTVFGQSDHLTVSPQARTARTTGGGQASPAAGPKASRERRAAGGVATAWPEAKGYNLIKFFMTDDVRRIHPGSHGKGDLRDYR